ncbi:MAG: M55 family metallopeptidase, partial [Clostridia bacterium]|nr:M55 family metallopeptidase [Clostridia bacterium]
MKRYLITVDLEGVFGVVGEKNIGLTRSIADYPVAVANATEEINTAVKALFDCGADEVVVWDGHGGGNNIDFDKIDTRATKIDTRSLYCPQRFDNASLTEFCGAVFIGYH